jgi:hypothetical protein
MDPTQCLYKSRKPRLICKAASGDVQHQSMYEEIRPLGIARYQRISGEVIESVAQVLILTAWDRNVEEKFRYFFR